MQRLSRPLSACGPPSSSNPLWSRSQSQPLPLPLSRSQSLPCHARTVRTSKRSPRPRPWPKKVRQVPMRNTYPVYDLSGLILDLDAEGNKHVRKNDPIADGVPDPLRTVHNYEQLALNRRIQGFEARYRQDSERSDRTSAQEYNPWHVSDVDIISCTLLGPPSKVLGEHFRINETASTKFEDITHTVQWWNGIPRHAQEDVARGVPYLMHRQKKHKKAAENLGVRSLKLFTRRIQQCGNVTELRRVVQILLARPGGCELISPSDSAIASHCQELELMMSRDELRDLAVFLNDVAIKLASEKRPIPPFLAGMGLRAAASHGAFPAMQMYFAATGTWKMKNMTRYVDGALARALLFLTSQPGHGKDQSGIQGTRASRIAAYTTLTGYSIYGHHFGASFQKVIRTRWTDPMSHHQHFLHLLGELGAFRTIWHIYQKSARGEAPLIPPNLRNWFVASILRALRNVQSGRITFAPESVEHATGDYEADCKLDLQTIMSSSINTGPTKAAGDNNLPKLGEYPSLNDEMSVLYHNLDSKTISHRSWLDILGALRERDITVAMSRLMEIIHDPEPS